MTTRVKIFYYKTDDHENYPETYQEFLKSVCVFIDMYSEDKVIAITETKSFDEKSHIIKVWYTSKE